MTDFHEVFLKKYFKEIHNNKYTYYDTFRTSSSLRTILIYYLETGVRLINSVFKFFTKNYITQDDYNVVVVNKNNFFTKNIEKLEETYTYLSDDYSKDKYIDYIVFRAIGSFKNRLPFDEIALKLQLKKASNLLIDKKLNIYDLNSIDYNLKFLGSEIGIVLDFILEQYAYKKLINIEVENEDVVIDCGGATGDTALYFHAKGAKKVYVYEFLPSSINTINKQLLNNNIINNDIEIIENAIWDESNIELSYLDKGNASVVDQKGKYSSSVITLSIDDLVRSKNLDKVNFIKMDIEGAEVSALNGAYECIKRYKPKLAISVYHKNDDLIAIPTIIKNINPNYELYFDYYTNTGAEAILYAIDKDSL